MNEDLFKLHERVKKLEAMHDQTTHVHKDDMLRVAQELLVRARSSSNPPGLYYDIGNWLEWYQKGGIKE